jgi:acetyl-CoA acetyltransferase
LSGIIKGVKEMTLKDKYAFIGVGVTPQGKIPDMNTDELAAQAIRLAIQDAGINKQEIDGYIYQQGIGGGPLGTNPLVRVGIPAKFAWEVQSMGNYAIAMTTMAIGAMEAGLCNTVVLVHASSASSQRVLVGGAGGQSASTQGAYGWFGPGATAACMARRKMHLHGLTRRQLGSVSLTLREYANQRPEAVMHNKKIAMDDYLNARMIVEPLCLFDFCLVNDGAVALIITHAERVNNYRKPAVFVMGYGVDHSIRELGESPQALYHWDGFITQKAGEQAFKMAEVSLKDVDVAELYDAFTIFLLSQLESYGICKKGEAGPFVEAGNLKLHGSFPSNTSGTELSWSYLMGFSHLTEGIRQMRGESGPCQVKGAEIAMVTGLGGAIPGGTGASCCILRR